jgi:thiol-disulfide isomerase/thioredoxin
MADSAPAVTVTDFSQYKTADDLWAAIQKMSQGPGDQNATPDQVIGLLKGIVAATDQFQALYPKDPRRYEAKLDKLQFQSMLDAQNSEPTDPAQIEKVLNEVANAADAPKDAKQEAQINLIAVHAAGMQVLTDPVDKEILKFVHDYPDDADDAQLQKMRIDSVQQSDEKAASKLMETLSKDKNDAVAKMAKGEIAKRDLLKKPLDLKFTDLSGAPVDLAKLRGKVVIVDFWATWCAPCMEMVPLVVQTYNDLHSKGLEVIGVSLDQDKSSVVAVTKAQGMVWPQYFDGKMWDNEISSRYGISSIPAMWLINKKGMVIDTAPEDDLEGKAKKLLSE